MVQIDETTLALTFAVVGVLFSIAWLVLGLYGIDSLRDIRNHIAEENGNEG